MSDIDLFSLFNAASGILQENQGRLNEADGHNGDHGDNMVDIFELISGAVQEKGSASAADQLAHAGKVLSKKQSGSAQLYAKGLSEAANQFEGQGVTEENALQLIQTMMGAGEAPAAESPIEGLLGGLLGGGQDDEPGLDVGDLLNAGMAFMAAKQRGESNVEALVDAVVSASPLSQTPHRQQSGQMVVGAMMEMLSNLPKK